VGRPATFSKQRVAADVCWQVVGMCERGGDCCRAGWVPVAGMQVPAAGGWVHAYVFVFQHPFLFACCVQACCPVLCMAFCAERGSVQLRGQLGNVKETISFHTQTSLPFCCLILCCPVLCVQSVAMCRSLRGSWAT